MSDSELRCDISYSSSVNTTTSQAVVIPQVHSRDTSPYPSSSLGPSSIAESKSKCACRGYWVSGAREPRLALLKKLVRTSQSLSRTY